jgi:flagellar protein FlaG
MDSATSARSIGVAALGAPRSTLAALRQTARTELPADMTVTAGAAVENVKLDISTAGSAMRSIEDAVRRATVVDPQTRQMVFRATDPRSGRVLVQIPDEALLRLRAYVQKEAARQSKASEGLKVEKIA